MVDILRECVHQNRKNAFLPCDTWMYTVRSQIGAQVGAEEGVVDVDDRTALAPNYISYLHDLLEAKN